MKRSVWKWICGISVAVLILLILFTFGLWILLNVGGVLLRMLFILDADMTVSGIPFGVFMANFVGSPLFYAYVADIAVLAISAVALLVARKRHI